MRLLLPLAVLAAVAAVAPAGATAPAHATPPVGAAPPAAAPGPAQDGRTIQRGVLRPGIGAADPRRPVDVRAEPWSALGRVQLEV
ncbi:MAG: hypothetical protein ICV73_02775, partial [Acetobacteraceae bacterium]|nr:hypothetical protein [Acetobacteraceae bacterium]